MKKKRLIFAAILLCGAVWVAQAQTQETFVTVEYTEQGTIKTEDFSLEGGIVQILNNSVKIIFSENPSLNLTYQFDDINKMSFKQRTYSISASTITAFGILQTPYTQPEAQTVTITNTGTGLITLTQPTSTDYDIGTLSTTTLPENGTTATFTIQPKASLPVGNHDETITINGSNSTNAMVSAMFTVTDGNSIENIDAEKFKVHFDGNILHITAVQPIGKISVYSITGVCIAEVLSNTDTAQINLTTLSKGTYIVQAGTNTVKIIK